METSGLKERERWSRPRLRCWVCGRRVLYWKELQTHEMVSGVHRHKGIKDASAWIRTCWKCHPELHDYSKWPLACALALKKLHDPKHYNRTRVNQLRCRADTAITEEEVEAFAESIKTLCPA